MPIPSPIDRAFSWLRFNASLRSWVVVRSYRVSSTDGIKSAPSVIPESAESSSGSCLYRRTVPRFIRGTGYLSLVCDDGGQEFLFFTLRYDREQVLDAFWASLNPSAAAANLRKTLFDLRTEFAARRVTEPVVTIADDMVVLSPEISLDIDEFRACARAARYARDKLELYEGAIACYGGDLLVEDRYEEWTEGPRQELRDLHNELLIELSQLYAAAGKLELAVERLQHLLQADPLDEEANRLMMRVYAEGGSRQKAHRQYETFRDALRQAIGATPSEETDLLYREILAGNSSAAQ